MASYDIGPGMGLAHIDRIINTPNARTGESFDSLRAVDEAVRMVAEVEAIATNEMANVPPSVQNSIRLLMMAVACLTAIVRARVVTELPEEPHHAAR